MDKIVIALNMIIDYVDRVENVNEKEITEFLYNTGFDDYEVRQTLSILDFNNFNGDLNVRYFSRAESEKFTNSALNYLQKLNLSGFMDFVSLDKVVEKVWERESYKVGTDYVKQVVLMILLEKKSYFSQNYFDGDDFVH